MTAPGWLSKEQAAIWRATVKLVAGPFTAQRRAQLEAYAVERARWLDCEAHVREHGAVYMLRSDKGEVRQIVEAPEVKIANRAQDRMLKLGAQLGLGRVTADGDPVAP